MFVRRLHSWSPLRGRRSVVVVPQDAAAIYTCARCGGPTKLAPYDYGTFGRDDGLHVIQLPVCLACLEACPTCGHLKDDLCDACVEMLDGYEVPAPKGDA